ncbi:MAG: hypothetical protein CL902_03985 [Dehalococcoidia bacterium]|nr:hypothetical protein [Dehalococcoidia bacterium]
MKPTNWVSLLGNYRLEDGNVVFNGGVFTEDSGQTTIEVGNFVCDRELGDGTISSTIIFHDDPSLSSAGLILYYHPSTGAFVAVRIGGDTLVSVRTFTNQQWIDHGSHGPSGQLKEDQPYQVVVHVVGSRVRVSLDGIQIIDVSLSFTLPRGQTGIWASGLNDISFIDFDVEPERPKLFVVMQFTEPFNDLYSEVIQKIGEDSGFTVNRADETYGPGVVIADIAQSIVEAKAIIADITPNNPNVYWEVGYAHALRKPTILIAERETPLPFDVSPFRTLFYDNTIFGKSKLEEGLKNHIKEILEQWAIT